MADGHVVLLPIFFFFFFFCLLLLSPGGGGPFMCFGIRSFPVVNHHYHHQQQQAVDVDLLLLFSEAPEYRNGHECPSSSNNPSSSMIHVAMTLDSEYLRGSIAAIHSVVRHASCPENIFFHLIADPSSADALTRVVGKTFPSLINNFKVYMFRQHTVKNLISSSIRVALENPLNYARNYLGDILGPDVEHLIYLDSDVVLVDDIQNLWSYIDLLQTNNRVIGAPEYCHANFTKYFTDTFWRDPLMSRVFMGRRRRCCYFNTGVMVMDMVKWRSGKYRQRIERWMELQRNSKRIYELGSLPPFLLVFAGNIEPIDHRWNQHGLGGDNVKGSCRSLHAGPVSLLHWSGQGKPWVRLDQHRPCPLDYLWRPYDLLPTPTPTFTLTLLDYQ